MIYADYQYYKEQFCGNLIPQERFKYLSARASEYIDWQTFGRLESGVPDEYSDKVKKCCCALAESEFQSESAQNGNISSEKVGSYSVTFSVKSDVERNAEKNRIIVRYLGNTGLLYRGVD